jgi:hypothetical protein
MKASPFNQKTIAEFHAKQGRGVGMWGDHLVLMTARGAALPKDDQDLAFVRRLREEDRAPDSCGHPRTRAVI